MSALLLAGCQSIQSSPVEPYSLATLAEEKLFVDPDCTGEQCAEVRVSALEFPRREALTKELRARLMALAPLEGQTTPAGATPGFAGYADAFFDQARRQGGPLAGGGASEALLEADIYARHNDLLVIELNGYTYLDGQAHGLPSTEFMVIDERQARTVGLDDMLIEGREAAFEALVRDAHQRWLSELDEGPDMAENWPLTQSRNVAPLGNRFVVKYDVYEIAPYALGQPELDIPLEALRGVAKPRYLEGSADSE
ncbi:RsiV family protein [Halomonas sp. HNIBRBA4712]|uniref:RsiV family protein n=1 Tax=Halomonas sp. HNIBRBA4712 TaxID=3373087 RepID=UPI00374655EB